MIFSKKREHYLKRPMKFEDEHPEAAEILATIYSEPPRYHRNDRMRYFTKRWHLTDKGLIEISHKY